MRGHLALLHCHKEGCGRVQGVALLNWGRTKLRCYWWTYGTADGVKLCREHWRESLS